MSDSLRDQLLKAGFAPASVDKPRAPASREQGGNDRKAAQPPSQHPLRKKPRNEEFDLARAYAVRAQAEKTERARAEREAQRQAQERRERKRKLQELLSGNIVAIAADAECVRHFEHAGKIRRIHVDAAQLAALNKGELGVVVQGGRFLLVARETALKARAIADESVALLVDPDAPANIADDGVPDDLMW
ncbi:MAG TPA: DUF2058 family protein [Rhodanobacteraceae bacterium]|nr:DUF2058 family protein [Rhodanobacteraceae bacterium]